MEPTPTWEQILKLARALDEDCAAGRAFSPLAVARLARAVVEFQGQLSAGVRKAPAPTPLPDAAVPELPTVTNGRSVVR